MAGITFQLVDCLNQTANMNSSNTNAGGWNSSAMRTRMSTYLSQLPAALRNVIKTVNKRTSAGNQSSSIQTTQDKLFLLSEIEIFGATTYSFAGEGTQYEHCHLLQRQQLLWRVLRLLRLICHPQKSRPGRGGVGG